MPFCKIITISFLMLSFFLSRVLFINSFDQSISLIKNDYENSYTSIYNYETTNDSMNISEKKRLAELRRYLRTKIIRIRKRKTTRPTQLLKNCGSPIILPSINEAQINRIVNGSAALLYSWPWIVSIREITTHSFDHKCGGTIISDRYILTAAHCLREYETRQYIIMVGLNDLNEPATSNNSMEIEKVLIHPNYNDRLLNDLAIVKLKKKLIFTYKIAAICLPLTQKKNLAFSRKVVVIGWGSVSGQRPNTSSELRQTILEVVNNKTNNTCNKELIDLYCAIDFSDLKSNICYGDSGGPMMIKDNNTWYLYGIANFLTGFSSSICDNRRPSYYLVVTNYLKWIYNIIT